MLFKFRSKIETLKKAWGVVATFARVPRERNWLGKEGSWEVGELLSNTPCTFQGTVGGYTSVLKTPPPLTAGLQWTGGGKPPD